MSRLKNINGVVSNFLRDYARKNSTISLQYFKAKMFEKGINLGNYAAEKRCKLFNLEIV